MVLFGADEPEDLHTAFFQETNFLYLSGWREPGAVMLLTEGRDPVPAAAQPASRDFHRPQDSCRGLGCAGKDRVRQGAAARPRSNPRFCDCSRHRATCTRFRAIRARRSWRAGAASRRTATPAAEIARLRVVKSPAEIELHHRSRATRPWRRIWRRGRRSSRGCSSTRSPRR